MAKVTRRQIVQSLVAAAPLALTTGSQVRAGQRGPTLLLAQSDRLRTVRYTLSWLPSAMDAALFVGIGRNYFTEEGLRINFDRGFGSADSITKIAAGQYELGEGDPNSMIEFNARNPGQKLVAVYLHFNRSPFGIFSLKKSGITDPKQLAGKRLGAPAGDAPRRMWPLFAKQVGIEAESVTWVTMEPRLRETFLQQGQVDAVSGFITSVVPPLVKLGNKLEDIQIFNYNDHNLDLYGNGVITTTEYAQKNADVVKAFVRAKIRAWKDTIKDPKRALELVMNVSKNMGLVMEEDSERLRMEIAMSRLFITPEVRANGLGDVVPERKNRAIEQVTSVFGISPRPALKEVFDNSFLPPKSERMIA